MRALTRAPAETDRPVSPAESIAREWARAIGRTGFVPLNRHELRALLTTLAGRLLDALSAGDFDPDVPYQVGAALVEAHFTRPAALQRTIAVLGEHLSGPPARLAALHGALAAGYAGALQERTLAEQERISAAALAARAELQDRLRHQALHDPLTGLPNRTLFFDRLGAALADPDTRVGLCYLDLDGFKVVNDTLGHDVGDRLLQAVAGRLDAVLGGDGHLVARMGGDEFVILVAASARNGSRGEPLPRVAQAALDAVRAPVRLDGREIRVSASIGVVEAGATITAAELMKAADTTLYWAKADGRGRWAPFDPDRHARDVSRYRLSTRMPEALARGEFFVEFQPLVRLADDTVTGVEALVRWRHRELGVLAPDEFVGLAEETGLIVPLGRWVLAEACRQGRAWQDALPDRPPLVSVNLAARQVGDPGIVKDVARILAETGLNPGRLQLELTESAIMGTGGTGGAGGAGGDRAGVPDESLATLYALAELGVRIAIDDFGTGYSNLAYLRELPVHALKLAGPFVSGAGPLGGSNRVDHEIVATVVRLAHNLDLEVTAESVETAEQARRLRALGCDTAQGWYFGRSGPPGSVAPLLGKRLLGRLAA